MNSEETLAITCIADNRPTNGEELRPASIEPQLSVLLIEDDIELCDLMREFFARAEFALRRSTMAGADWHRPLRSPTI